MMEQQSRPITKQLRRCHFSHFLLPSSLAKETCKDQTESISLYLEIDIPRCLSTAKPKHHRTLRKSRSSYQRTEKAEK